MPTTPRNLHVIRRAAVALERARQTRSVSRLPAAGGSGGSTAHIVESITAAIVEQGLVPGTKLVEQKIADIFKVSRTLVRQALHQLSRDRLVTLEPARGAFIAEPSVQEARQVFEVRALLEAAVVKHLCRDISKAQIAQLRAHLMAEALAVAGSDASARTRLLADFHVLLAHMLGNQVLAELLTDLLTRSALVTLMYPSSHSAEQAQAEHVAIVDALEQHDARAAVSLLESHLGNVERKLHLNPRISDPARVLQPG